MMMLDEEDRDDEFAIADDDPDFADDDEDQDQGDEAAEDDDGDEEFVGFDDKPEPETPLVKQLRAKIVELYKRPPQAATVEPDIVVGDRPDIEDFDWDKDKFNAAIDAWDERRAAAAKQKSQRDGAKASQEAEWIKVKDNYQAKRAKLPYADVSEAEGKAFESLSATQQAVIAKLADNPAMFIYAVGKSPNRLAELSATDDPLMLAKKIATMEMTLTTRKRARPPEPESRVRGRAPSMSGGDKAEARMLADAEKTNNYTKYSAYLADKRKAK